jgi:hypothetical protein
VDRGYLRIQRAWREDASKRMECPLLQVESDIIVPVEETSAKEEHAAATIRAKIMSAIEGPKLRAMSVGRMLARIQISNCPRYSTMREESPASRSSCRYLLVGRRVYEMLTGELPLGKFAPPSLKVHIDVRLDEVVLHALEKEPERSPISNISNRSSEEVRLCH